jgi:hypothetical protein
MGSSGGGGSSRPPNQPTPSGPIADFGASTDFNPGFTNVLSAGWATPESIDAGLAAGPQYRTPPPPPPMPGGGPGGGMAGMDAFAQQVMDWRKGAMTNPLYAMQHAPTAQGPAQQLMLSAAQSDPRSRLASLMGAYNARGVSSGGGGNRGGYSSSRS